MYKIELEFAEWQNEVDTKGLDAHHYVKGSGYMLVAFDGRLLFWHRLEEDDKEEYEAKYMAGANKKIGDFYSREPFASKKLRDGSSLFRRKYGIRKTIPANSELEIIFTVPYGKAKINKLEVIDANPLDRVDLYVKSPVDPAVAAAYLMEPNVLLNQFGFDVIVSALLYSDKSDYDADVYMGMQVIVKYKNDTENEKTVGFNLIYHEVK